MFDSSNRIITSHSFLSSNKVIRICSPKAELHGFSHALSTQKSTPFSSFYSGLLTF